MIYQPEVSEKDYERLQQIMRSQLPRAYEDWTKLCCQLAQDGSRMGFVRVKIKPDAFAAFIKDGSREPSLKTLLIFCNPDRTRRLN